MLTNILYNFYIKATEPQVLKAGLYTATPLLLTFGATLLSLYSPSKTAPLNTSEPKHTFSTEFSKITAAYLTVIVGITSLAMLNEALDLPTN